MYSNVEFEIAATYELYKWIFFTTVYWENIQEDLNVLLIRPW